MLELEVTSEVVDHLAEIGRRTLPVAKPAAYDSPEGVLFRKALALIADERGWCQHAMAVYENGAAVKFCSLGAIDAVQPNANDIYSALDDAIGGDCDGFRISRFNDSHTHAEVIAKWHEAGHANGWLV